MARTADEQLARGSLGAHRGLRDGKRVVRSSLAPARRGGRVESARAAVLFGLGAGATARTRPFERLGLSSYSIYLLHCAVRVLRLRDERDAPRHRHRREPCLPRAHPGRPRHRLRVVPPARAPVHVLTSATRRRSRPRNAAELAHHHAGSKLAGATRRFEKGLRLLCSRGMLCARVDQAIGKVRRLRRSRPLCGQTAGEPHSNRVRRFERGLSLSSGEQHRAACGGEYMAIPGTFARHVLACRVFRGGVFVRPVRDFDFNDTVRRILALPNNLDGRRLCESDKAPLSCTVGSPNVLRFSISRAGSIANSACADTVPTKYGAYICRKKPMAPAIATREAVNSEIRRTSP